MTTNPQSDCKHYCGHCGQPKDNEAGVCSACGKLPTKFSPTVSEPAALNAPAGTVCNKCGRIIPSAGTKEPYCHCTRLQPAVPAPAEHQGVQGEDDEEDYPETSTEGIAKLAANMNAKLAAEPSALCPVCNTPMSGSGSTLEWTWQCPNNCSAPQPVAGEGATRNSEVLASFVRYCQENPEHRFWQALRNWSGYPFITVSDFSGESRDTFYWKGKRHDGK